MSLVEASIQDLSAALASGCVTSVELVAKYLLRISRYDCRNLALNSVPLLSESVFEDAAAADDRRARGEALGPLDGIPFTVKDSYKVKGMTTACGSEAFERLVANEDAHTVRALRDAGAVLLGRTNMCPMAYGGMLRGVYGRAESPYNADYLPAAFGSGSSNGSAVSVSASFAAFGMGEETVSSGRSPASNNALVAYTPSRGLISIRGNWPLYPTCDVVVPHTRTMNDLFVVLDAVTTEDRETRGDFWRDQPFLEIPTRWTDRPQSFVSIKDANHLEGKRIAVPRMYLESRDNALYISDSVQPLFHQARNDLEAAGATVEVVEEFPVMAAYERTCLRSDDDDATTESPRLPKDWNATERGPLIAHAWEDFLQNNNDPNFTSLTYIDPLKIFPHFLPDNPQVKFTEPANAIKWSQLASYVANRPPRTEQAKSPIYDIPQLGAAVQALEDIRKKHLEDWMAQHNFDYVAFPAAGDVARADADVHVESAKHAWTDGVKYSHGNRALRHLGIPSVTVPMGLLEPQNMPLGLTFLGKAYEDTRLLQVAYAFEQKSKRRTVPGLTPPLRSDAIDTEGRSVEKMGALPMLSVTKCCAVSDGKAASISIEGSLIVSQDVTGTIKATEPNLEIYIDGIQVAPSSISITTQTSHSNSRISKFTCESYTPLPPVQDERNRVVGKVARDSVMIMILARDGREGRPSGFLKLLHSSEL